MTTRLVLLATASTAALRSARFSDDGPLDEGGREQAARLAPDMGRSDHVVSSPARAALETADLLGRPADVDPRLGDWDLGGWKGRTLAELSATDETGVGAWISDPQYAAHGGESLIDLLDRVQGWLAAAAAEDRRVLAVTHPAVIRGAVVLILDAPPSAFWKIDVAPLSRTVVHATDGRWRLRAISQQEP